MESTALRLYKRNWQRKRRGIPLDAPKYPKRPPIERWWAFVDKAISGCWLWKGGTALGYGVFGGNGISRSAHRFGYIALVGPIAEGLQLDHLCRNTLCVNPAHLEPVTPLVNTRRAWATRTHCLRGHAFTEANTYIHRNHRVCRQCTSIRARAWREKSRGK